MQHTTDKNKTKKAIVSSLQNTKKKSIVYPTERDLKTPFLEYVESKKWVKIE